jgi:hypothetical protein
MSAVSPCFSSAIWKAYQAVKKTQGSEAASVVDIPTGGRKVRTDGATEYAA